MSPKQKAKLAPDAKPVTVTPPQPFVFVSHDSRDSELAEAFAKLLKSVSAGMIKTFHSSDKKDGEGIEFGDEWYKSLMERLQLSSDVVCLFTERSLDRPWILFEAGAAKSKLSTVFGVALGVPLSRVSTGPFYQFQNMDDSEGDLKKLLHQIARRIPTVELDPDVVHAQVAAFKSAEEALLKKLSSQPNKKAKAESPEDEAIVKLSEEIKSLPSRISERMQDIGSHRKIRFRRWHPMMLEDFARMGERIGDPIGILMAASIIRDDAPWMYEISKEVYESIRSGDPSELHRQRERLARFASGLVHGPFLEELFHGSREQYIMVSEFPRVLLRLIDEFMGMPRVDAKRSHKAGVVKDV